MYSSFNILPSAYTLVFSFFLDNGPHYHNSGVLFYLAEVNDVFNVTLKEYNNFEAGEGKSRLDSHFAHISHKIVRWVRLGNDLESGEQVANLIKVMFHSQLAEGMVGEGLPVSTCTRKLNL